MLTEIHATRKKGEASADPPADAEASGGGPSEKRQKPVSGTPPVAACRAMRRRARWPAHNPGPPARTPLPPQVGESKDARAAEKRRAEKKKSLKRL